MARTAKPRLFVSVSEAEKRILADRAALLGMSENGYIRMKVFAPTLDTSIHLTDRMQATAAIGLAINATRRLEIKLKQQYVGVTDDLIGLAIVAELNRLQENLSVAYEHLAQVNPYAG